MLAGTVGLIIVVAGYGSVRTHKGIPIPKVLEDVGGVPMFLRPLLAAEKALIERTTIVVNPTNETLVRDAVDLAVAAGTIRTRPLFVIQEERRGSADAVMRALPGMHTDCIDKVVIAYGDMPLWSSETMLELLAHSESSEAAMVTVCRRRSLCALNRYGRVLHDATGKILRVVEATDATPEELRLTVVNPSLWLWPVDWLAKHIPVVRLCERLDGFGPERHLPPLVDMASCSMRIAEVPLPDKRAHEALGVNTLAELRKVRSFFG